MKQLIALFALCFMATTMSAQDEPEYRLELGAGVGLMNYLGDMNGNLLRGMKPAGSLVVKYKPNPRMAWALIGSYGSLKGSSATAKTWYPSMSERMADFNTSLVDVSVRYEYNFWPFGTGREYYGAKKLTPFIALGLGASIANAKLTQDGIQTKSSSVAGQLPIGLERPIRHREQRTLQEHRLLQHAGTDAHIRPVGQMQDLPQRQGLRKKNVFEQYIATGL